MERYLIVIVLLLCTVPYDVISQTPVTMSCPSGWEMHGNKCYHFSHDTETWADAMIMCRLDGAVLAEINSATENAYLQARAKALGGLFWVGGTDVVEENVWMWASSKTPIATGIRHWSPGQPDNAGSDENCLEINYSSRYWNDRPCHNVQKYICQMEDDIFNEIVG